MTSPEQIVRALAAAEPIYDGHCAMCHVHRLDDEHKPDCPWRLAVEWVAAQVVEDPDGRTGDYFRHRGHDSTLWRLRGREAGGERRYVLERDDGRATLSLLPETFAEFVAEQDGPQHHEQYDEFGRWIPIDPSRGQ